MRAEGLETSHNMDQLTVMGFGSALAAYPRLSNFADMLVEEIVTARPRLIITVDVKGFSLRLAARLRRRMKRVGWSAPIIHVVAPTVWAWGAWRRHRVARVVDGLLCLFPFEPDYFLPLGVTADFIGHPEAFNPVYDKPHRLPADDGAAPHLVILPGSRRSEIQHLLRPMLQTLGNLRDTYPQITATIPTLPSMHAEIEAGLSQMPDVAEAVMIDEEEGALFRALGHGNAVLAASGTVTLQTALYGVPGVACYITSGLSAAIGRRLVRMDRVILPNAILDRQVYPFLFQEAATADAMTQAMLRVLNDNEAVTRAGHDADELRRVLRGTSNSFDDNVMRALAGWLTPSQE